VSIQQLLDLVLNIKGNIPNIYNNHLNFTHYTIYVLNVFLFDTKIN
jgi:hypothetical protein